MGQGPKQLPLIVGHLHHVGRQAGLLERREQLLGRVPVRVCLRLPHGHYLRAVGVRPGRPGNRPSMSWGGVAEAECLQAEAVLRATTAGPRRMTAAEIRAIVEQLTRLAAPVSQTSRLPAD
jgi:hypothetical protein